LRRKKKSALVALYFFPCIRHVSSRYVTLVCVFLQVHPSASMAMSWPSKAYAIRMQVAPLFSSCHDLSGRLAVKKT
jgi:hypothetical protein